MFDQAYLTTLLKETERAHAASGHGSANWAHWYAQYMLPILTERMESEKESRRANAWG